MSAFQSAVFIKRFIDALNVALPIEQRLGTSPSSLCEFPSEAFLSQKLSQGCSDRRRVSSGDNQARDAVFEKFLRAPFFPDHHGGACRHRIGDRDTEPFEIASAISCRLRMTLHARRSLIPWQS